MPSQPLETGWNFSPVFDLIDSDSHDVMSPNLRPSEAPPSTLPGGGVGLGNFSKLFESLGLSTDTVAALPPLEESELSNSDDALLPPPVFDVGQISTTHTTADAEPHHETAENVSLITKKQRRKARRAAERALLEQSEKTEALEPAPEGDVKALQVSLAKEELKAETVPETPTKPTRARSNVGAKIRPASPGPVPDVIQVPQTPASRPKLAQQSRSSNIPVTPQPQVNRGMSTPAPVHFAPVVNTPVRSQSPTKNAPTAGSGLVPRTVRPLTVPRRSYPAAVQPRVPTTPTPAPYPSTFASPQRSNVVLRPQEDRHFHLFEKLLAQFPAERKHMIAPRQLVNETTRAEGIHVFVDASNIMIGFKDMLRLNGVQYCDMSFDSLALLMERRRPVAKRCFVGSHREANPLPQITRLVELSKAVGYECNVQEQVLIVREESEKRRFFNDVNRIGWQKAVQKRSGSGSDSETGTAAAPKTPSAPKWVEQGVDELLHLKICQSIIDTEVPSTIVLATGDGAEAEMSDGFLAHVERALRNGWKVELVTWRQQTNGGYKRKAFRQKWGEQFTIIELDDFLEDLIDTP